MLYTFVGLSVVLFVGITIWQTKAARVLVHNLTMIVAGKLAGEFKTKKLTYLKVGKVSIHEMEESFIELSKIHRELSLLREEVKNKKPLFLFGFIGGCTQSCKSLIKVLDHEITDTNQVIGDLLKFWGRKIAEDIAELSCEVDAINNQDDPITSSQLICAKSKLLEQYDNAELLDALKTDYIYFSKNYVKIPEVVSLIFHHKPKMMRELNQAIELLEKAES